MLHQPKPRVQTGSPGTARKIAESPTPWLLLVHQLPVRPSNVRVKTWRRLQDLGAVAVKNSVYALPNTAATQEDFRVDHRDRDAWWPGLGVRRRLGGRLVG
jgi:hypothetical protein